jgi:hypothetical protein
MPRTRVRSTEEGLELLREQGAMTLVPTGRAPALVEAVTGEPVRGSWWGHPAARRIQAIATGLEASSEVLVLKLVGGKLTFLHRDLWSPLARVAMDRRRRREAMAALSEPARDLLDLVMGCGQLRLDQVARERGESEREISRTATALELELLVHGQTVYTERRRHAVLLRTWERALPARVRREARRFELAEAEAILGEHGASLDGLLRTWARR